jgi:hypothetical protein
MKTIVRDTVKSNRKGLGRNVLRSAFAILALGSTLYAHDSDAVLVLANGETELEWYVGQQVPSIDLSPDEFVVLACGAELAWVYDNFPTIATRKLPGTTTTRRAATVAAMPAENVCVLWRGDNARFIADNLAVTGS